MRPVLFLLLFVCFGSSAYAVQRIPYYRMDSLAFLSSDIVLCEEGATVEVKKKNSSGYDYECSECSVTVIQVLQGSLKPNQQITIEIGTIFTRTFAKEALIQPTEKRSVIPKGKVLLFLNKDKEIWKPETGGVKLIFKNEVYCYGQFLSNPGPLWLARMAPENFELDASQPYGEELLLKDVKAALEKAKALTKAIPIWPHDKSIIREEPSKSGKNGVPDQLGKKEVEIPASKSLAELELILEKNESAIRSKKQISEIIRELEKAERCEVFRLNPKLLINRVDGEIKVKKGSFHGYESQDLHGQTEKADQLKDITTFIGKSMHWSNLRKGACFNPRHGLRITVGKRTLEFVICFECWTIKVYEGENSLGSFAFLESKENPIEKLMKDAEEKPKSRP